MAKPLPELQLNNIVNVVSRFPEGARFGDIQKALGDSAPSRRNLQNHLNALLRQFRLRADGATKARRYFTTAFALAPAPAERVAEIPPVPGRRDGMDATGSLPLSAEASAIRQAVMKPLHERHPAGYRRAFLDDYRPNRTYYLSPEMRAHLLQAGHAMEGERPAGTYARNIMDRLLIDLSWNSSRLEGNTYSLLETERLLELGESASGKNAKEAQMILNHKAAIEFLVNDAGEVAFNRHTILSLHALLSENLLPDPSAGGRLRDIPVRISGTVFYPLEIPQMIEECFQKILETAAAIADPFEQAFFVMVHIPYLQPFEDVNKRVSRLAANIPMIQRNLCPLSFIDVPEQEYISGCLAVYELNRIELLRDVFVWAYERSCARYSAIRQSLGEPDLFRLRYRDLVKETVNQIVTQGMDKTAAIQHIRAIAGRDLPAEVQARFIEVVETELRSLHDGNIARYRLRPSQYQSWKETWR